jgi:hypothetical protein
MVPNQNSTVNSFGTVSFELEQIQDEILVPFSPEADPGRRGSGESTGTKRSLA